MPADEPEIRTLEGLRAEAAGASPRLAGHAIVTGIAADLGFAREIIGPDALQRALARQPDLRLLFDHDPARVRVFGVPPHMIGGDVKGSMTRSAPGWPGSRPPSTTPASRRWSASRCTSSTCPTRCSRRPRSSATTPTGSA